MKKYSARACRIRFAVSAFAFIVGAAMSSYAQAVEKQAGEQTLSQAERPVQAPIFDLGQFRMTNLRPSQNVTIKLVFAVQLQLKEDVSRETAKQLECWRHRLRSQVTTAIRSAELADYTEPDLARIQTLIRLRVNRVLPQPLVDRIYFTEFTVGDI